MVDLVKFKSLLKLGIADIGGTAITAVFWFFLASMIKPSEYGEISYYIASFLFWMVGQYSFYGNLLYKTKPYFILKK